MDDKYIVVYNTLDSFIRLWGTLLEPERRVCTIDCCVGNSGLQDWFLEHSDLVVSVIGITGLERILRLYGMIYLINVEDEKSPVGVEFQNLVRSTINHIEQAVTAHQSGSTKPKKYSLDYTDLFISRYIKNIVCSKRTTWDSSDFDDFISECRFILDNPDEYAGITYKIFQELTILYVHALIFKNNEERAPALSSQITQCVQKILDLFGEANGATIKKLKDIRSLWMEFDPIGVYGLGFDWPDDEYDAHVVETVNLLKEGVLFDELKSYVSWVVSDHMRIDGIDMIALDNFVKKLLRV